MDDCFNNSVPTERMDKAQPMACSEEMTDLTEEGDAQPLMGAIARLSLDSSPALAPKEPRFARKFSLRELEIQQTVGEW